MSKKIALLGLGAVRSGVVNILQTKKAHLEKTLGQKIKITKVLDLNSKQLVKLNLPNSLLASSIDEIISESTINIVIEAMSSIDFAYHCIKKALIANKSAITSNKDVIAQKGLELQEIASTQKVHLRIEACVCGRIPLLETLENDLVANEITHFKDIVNGHFN